METRDNRAGFDGVFAVLVVLMLLTCYLSWFTWFVSDTGGGLLVFGLYFAPLVHLGIAAGWRYSRRRDAPHPEGVAFLASGGLFVIAYFAAHQLVAVPDRVITVLGTTVDVGVLNLLGVAPVLAIAPALLKGADEYARLVVPVVLGCLFVDALLTLRLLQSNPMAAKMLATTEGAAMFGATGASGFYIVNSVAILLPALIVRAVQPKGQRWWVAVVLGATFMFSSGYLLTMVTATFAVLALGFFALGRQTRFLAAALTPIPLLAGLNPSLLAPALYWLGDKASFYEVSVRLHDLGDLLTVGGTGTPSLYRVQLYEQSWAAFKESPLFGIFTIDPHYTLSHHSTVLDLLGGMGLIGFGVFVVTLMNAYKLSMSVLQTQSQVAGLRAGYAALVFLAVVNPILNQPAITFSALVVTPMLLRGSTQTAAPSPRSPLPAARHVREAA